MTNLLGASLIALAILIVVLALVRATRLSFQNLVVTLAGAVTGLLIGALMSIPLGNLPAPYGTSLPLILSLVLMAVFAGLIYTRRQSILAALPLLRVGADTFTVTSFGRDILVDTSVIIDGRLADIAIAGFIPGRLLIPRFVLAELQNIADSEDAMRRGRGRRGLEMLNTIRETSDLASQIIDDDVSEIKEVDAKLVALARRKGADILTTDYNLNRVAQIEGVRVLNVNELSNAVRPVVIPGEQMTVKIVQAGKEKHQGVGYLADGTMIVVDQGDKLIGQEISTEVTRVFQTVAGKMIFAAPLDASGQPTTAAKKAHRFGKSGGKSIADKKT